MKQLLVFALLSMSLLGCIRKEGVFLHPEFVGDWATDENNVNRVMSISPNGNAYYHASSGGSNETLEGPLRVDKRERFIKISIRKFKINEYPGQRNGVWQMKLDGKTYYRY